MNEVADVHEVGTPLTLCLDHLYDIAYQEFETFLASVGAGETVEGVVLMDDPAEQILSAAAEWPADLVVLGTHGRTGVQAAEEDDPLRGVAYDPRDDRIGIMLGDVGLSDGHRTHTVTQVRGVDLLLSGDATSTLCIEHGGGGLTLLCVRRSPMGPQRIRRAGEPEVPLP